MRITDTRLVYETASDPRWAAVRRGLVMAAVDGADVGALLEGAVTDSVAQRAVDAVTLQARAYTRNQGFDGDVPNAEIAAAILTAACRLARNPGQLGTSEAMGPFTFDARRVHGLHAWRAGDA